MNTITLKIENGWIEATWLNKDGIILHCESFSGHTTHLQMLRNKAEFYNTNLIGYEEIINQISESFIYQTAEEITAYETKLLEDAKPKAITPLQARLALSQLSKRQAVEDSMLTSTQDVKDFYEFALEWRRDNAQLMEMATSLGMDSVAIDNFFLLASTK